MRFCLHDHHNLGCLERDLVEGQSQGFDAASFTYSRGLKVWVWVGNTGPGKSLGGGGVWGGGRRWWSTGGIPRVVWQDFPQVSFCLLQFCQCGVYFQRAWQFHIQLSCGEQRNGEKSVMKTGKLMALELLSTKLYKQQLSLRKCLSSPDFFFFLKKQTGQEATFLGR